MESSQRSPRHPEPASWLGRLACSAMLALVLLSGARSAAAHVDREAAGWPVQLDSATAVAWGAASPHDWRTASPLAVPDRFGPGAVLSVGNILMKVINIGMLGNAYGNTSSDPGAQWPGSSGVEYLNAIYFAAGAVNPTASDPNSIRRVSFNAEWRPPTLEAVDRIYRAFDGIINGQRYVNDDGDKDLTDPDHPDKIDEDFLDGRDNDGDGQIDEDHAALGQQEYSYVIRDDTREAINTVFNEKHVPVGLEAKVRAWAYSIQGFQDFNICEYKVTNVSGHMLDSLTIGWLVDMDAGPIQLSPYWTDDVDFPRYPSGEFLFRVGDAPGDLRDPARLQLPHDPTLNSQFAPDSALCPRVTLRVNAFSVADQDGDNGRTPGMGTFMLIDHTTDPTGLNGPRRVGFKSFRSTSGGNAFAQGGLPRTDQERFQSMVSTDGVDETTGFITTEAGGTRGDWAEWCSIGPWRNIQPGQTVTATIAFGVKPGTSGLANQYPTDYLRYTNGSLSGAELEAKYPALQNALAAQLAFEGINEPGDSRPGFPETQPMTASPNGRDFHGRETGIRLPRGSSPQTIVEDCSAVGRSAREVNVTDREYSWFDFDCDYCTGVWDFAKQRGMFHKNWNAEAPPPSPNTNVSALYNYTDNPNRLVAPSGDKAVVLAWDNISEVTPDPSTGWLDFRGFNVWKVADWTRPVGSAGPGESDWRLLGEFRIFDYFAGTRTIDLAYEHNYKHDATGAKVCPMVFVPNYFDPETKLFGKSIPVCLDRFDLWNKQSGEIIKPDWTVPCEFDTSGGVPPMEINTGDLEWGGNVTGGSVEHVFRTAGTFRYMCMRHTNQTGSVVVADGSPADSATVQITDASITGFSPATVTIRPGGRVRWVNVSEQNHALQSERACSIRLGTILGRGSTLTSPNKDGRVRYPVGRYQYVDREVKNGFTYFYSITAFDSVTSGSITTEQGGRRSAIEAEAVVPEARVDANGKLGVWVVPNPYKGYAVLRQRPSSWDLTPNASDPTGTHVDFMGLPPGKWTIRIYTVSGDLVQELRAEDAINESVRQPVRVGSVLYPGYNRQQDSPNDGQARWNLISRNGQDVVSGIYLFTVDSTEGTQRGKFIVIR